MKKEIKTSFTEKEISEYINELNAAIGNKRKINKLLDLSHLPILVAYLRQIGVSEELLSLAAVSEFTRYKMREILTDKTLKQCKVTDTGVIFEKNKKYSRVEKIGVDEFNVFWLGEEKYFGRQKVREDSDGNIIWPRDRYIRLQRKMYYYKDPDRPISKCGFALGRTTHSGGFCVIDEITRKKDGLYYHSTDKAEPNGDYICQERIYAGEAIEVEENENTFREHYEMYTTLFPKYRGFLNNWYLRGIENLDQVVKRTDSAIFKERIKKLIKRNPEVKGEIELEINRYKENKRKFEELYGFLDKYECETKEGRNTIDDIKATVKSRISVDLDTCQKNAEEYSRAEEIDLEETKIYEYHVDSLNEANAFAKHVNSVSDTRVGKVNDNNLGIRYHKLKENAERLCKNNEKLEDMLDILKNINSSNEKLIEVVEEKIRNIVKTKNLKEESKLRSEERII